MALHFLLDEPVTAGVGDAVTLTGGEAHHAAAVRRVRVGEPVTVGDGRGAWLNGIVEAVAPREVVIRIDARTDAAPARPRLVLVQALAKGDRDELAVQAATELGVDEVIPWQASRSVSRWEGAKAEKGRARWGAIVREAAKQAHRAWVPSISSVATTAEVAALADRARVFVLEPGAETALSGVAFPPEDERDIVLIVGPEGGISADELSRFSRPGATAVRLGHGVLRTSTAGPAALAVVSVALARW